MKYLMTTLSLILGTFGFSQVTEQTSAKVVETKEVKTEAKKPSKKKMKATKIDRPVIDKYTKPREVSEPKKENK